MGSKFKLLFITILIASSFGMLRAQDPHFSQFYANPLYLNPAFAGASVCPKMVINYRNQWPALPGSYVTYNASFDMHFKTLGGGLGAIITSDRAGEGALVTQQISLIYSARVRVSKDFYIKAGLQAGFFQKSVDWSRLTFGDQIDDRYGFSMPTSELPTSDVHDFDIDAGILGYSKMFYIGFAAHHLVPINEALIPGNKSYLPMKFTAHTGYKIPVTEKGRRRLSASDPIIYPNLLFMMQEQYMQMNYGLYYQQQPFIFGMWYRDFPTNTHDAIILLVGFEYDKFKFGYSYDLTVSTLGTMSGGAHEISYALRFNCPEKKVRLREIVCPSF